MNPAGKLNDGGGGNFWRVRMLCQFGNSCQKSSPERHPQTPILGTLCVP
jgi:hypothetical protein